MRFPLLLLAFSALAQDAVVFSFDGASGGLPSGWDFNRWAPVVTLGQTYETAARVVQDGGRPALYVRSANAGFTVGTKRTVDVSTHPMASWSWKAEELPVNGSFRRRSTNDQALQLFFGFEGGTVVGYIWDSTGSVGASGSGLSWQQDVRVIVVEAGASKVGQWVSEKRDLAADYRTLFGTDPPMLGGVGVQCNSQHTVSAGSGFVGPITLSAR